MRPRLHQIDPAGVALEVAQQALAHASRLVMGLLSPAYEVRTEQRAAAEEALLRQTQIYWTVLDLATYSRGRGALDASVQEYLVSLLPLYSACLGSGTAEVDGLVENEPETELGVVIAAALAREQLAEDEPLTSAQVAVLAGYDVNYVQALSARGEIPGARRVEGRRAQEWRYTARAVRPWIAERERAR